MSVVDAFESLLSATREVCGLTPRFRPGATAKAIQECQKKHGWDFPAELVEFMQHTNGEEGTSVFSFTSFCSLDEMAYAHQQLLDNEPNFLNTTDEERQLTFNPCIATDRRWYRHWIPLGFSVDCADILFLDTSPVNYLQQAIYPFTEEGCSFAPLATTLTELFQKTEEYIRREQWTPSMPSLPAVDLTPLGWDPRGDQ